MGIKSNTACFGNIGIIAIGDFYQCNPVASASIYTSMLWSDHFEYVELKINERQKENRSFAEMLNRIRKLKKKEEMIKEDKEVLKKCHERYLNKEYNPEALHLFAKNTDVDAHNEDMLNRLCKNIRLFHEIDKKGNEIEPNKNKRGNTLHSPLRLAKNARIMITKNISVADGLANGVLGRVVDFVENTEGKVLRILIECDSPYAGRLHRATCKYCYGKDTICVIRESENDDKYNDNSGSNNTNKQFPLKLSWAMTIHKAQGLTVEELVLSTKDLFASGMDYTGLSRQKTVERLFLKDLYLEKIYCDPNVEKNLSNMKKLNNENILNIDSNYINILFHNIEGLQYNIIGLQNHFLTKKAEIICIAETWLPDNKIENHIKIDGYQFIHRTRFNSFTTNNRMKLMQRGGVGIYIRNHLDMVEISPSITLNLEYLMIESKEKNLLLIVCYRSEQQHKKEFIKNLISLLNTIEKTKRILIIGDMNENSVSEDCKIISKALYELKFVNIFEKIATTNDLSSLDCIYTNFLSKKDYDYAVPGSFYSYHEPICTSIKLNATTVDVTAEINQFEENSLSTAEKTIQNNLSTRQSQKRVVKRKLNYDKTVNAKKLKTESFSKVQHLDFVSKDTEINESTSSAKKNLDIVAIEKEEEISTLNNQLSILGLHIVKIPGDGNCFFRAVSLQLYGHQNNHYQLRINAVDYIVQNKTHFEDFLWDEQNNIDVYIKNNRQLNTYADHAIIYSTALTIKRHIVIHKFRTSPSVISAGDNVNQQIHVVHYKYIPHYDSVQSKNQSIIQIPLNTTIVHN